jgi:hypothetical protein
MVYSVMRVVGVCSRKLMLSGLVVLCASLLCAAEEPDLPFDRLLVGGWGFGHVAEIEQDGTELWSVKPGRRENVCDLWRMASNRVLHVTGRGVRLVERQATGESHVLWEWAIQEGELHGCQPLPDNRVLLAVNTRSSLDLVELDATTREELKRVSITNASVFAGAHTTARSVRKTARGSYLVGRMAGKQGGAEISGDGEVLRRFPGARYGVFERPSGGYLAGGGDGRCVIAFDADGNEAWRIEAEDIPGFTLLFVAQVHEFEDGRILVANWGGHHRKLQGDDTPCLGLISADRKRLEWSAQLNPRNRAAAFCVVCTDEPEAR